MTLTIKQLSFDDFISLLDLADKIDIINPMEKWLENNQRDQIIAYAKEGESSELEQVGFSVMTQIIKLIIQRIPTHKEHIYSYMAQITESTPDVISQLPMVEAVELLRDFFMSQDFKQLGALFAQYKN